MTSILCVDDSEMILQMVSKVLESSGRLVETARDGDEALEKIAAREPALIVLDWEMPRVSGLEVCRAVKGNPFTARIPILMLTGQSDISNKIQGFEAGADDYLGKPSHPLELQARVEALLRLVQRESDRNPSSGLPGARAVRTEIERRVAAGEPFALCYIDLDHFKPFADSFGFDVADRVIEQTGAALCDAILEATQISNISDERRRAERRSAATPKSDRRTTPQTTHFAGHIGGDDFLVITDVQSAENIARACAAEFRKVIARILGDKITKAGHFSGLDREGRSREFPLAGLTTAIVVIDPATWVSTAHIGAFAAEVKRQAKNQNAGVVVQVA